jgi:hypothetical protein
LFGGNLSHKKVALPIQLFFNFLTKNGSARDTFGATFSQTHLVTLFLIHQNKTEKYHFLRQKPLDLISGLYSVIVSVCIALVAWSIPAKV